MEKTSPYFAFYASDTMADKRYRMMNLSERGLLISLMCECWVNREIPSDPDAIGKWIGFPGGEVRDALTERVLSFFAKDKTDLICPEIEKYRQKILEARRRQSKGGKKGAQARWNTPSSDDDLPNGLPNDLPNGVLDRIEKTGNEKANLHGKDDISLDQDEWVEEYYRHEQR